ncbi:hypothetical protein [Phenylobacterium sp.]|jgi:hypothetical protein|uniref:hypothetical protein n=1 Tax=Phenylobacterium sp. TaxID=1871053 RepID=UPI0037C4FBA0
MIEAMTVSAYELGTAAAEIAKAAGSDLDRFLAFTAEFRHCFFAVRMGIRLKVFGAPAPRVSAPAAASLERERLDPVERPERDEARRRAEADRERDRDAEPVSLPQFLKTLGIVTKAAEQARDQYPAHIRQTTLPRLQALLAQAAPPEPEPQRAGPALAVLARPPSAPPARSHLLNSAGAAPIIPARPPPRPSG